MSYGRVSVVLGVQAGLGAIIQFCGGARNGSLQPKTLSPIRHRLSDAEIVAVLGQLAQFEQILRRDDIIVQWTVMGASAHVELPLLFKSMGLTIEESAICNDAEISEQDLDALIYIPLDVQQPRQVEQLARLSMTQARTRHVCFAPVPKWNHAQLMALRETWEWIDPKQGAKIAAFADEMISLNGGITKKDLARIQLPEARKEESTEPEIITRSALMNEVLYLSDAVSDTDSTVLISGESGTGKELFAQRIHLKSHRRLAPMVAVNCGAIPEELLESELFGHVKGAFTGAVVNREGRFHAAEGGTLFLDEIGEMGPSLQVKLLRVLQTRKYEQVGSTKTRNANVRIVAATNRDLEFEVSQGRFRDDLYYRLNVIPVHVPSLKDRREDVGLLVEHFNRKFNREKSRRVTGVTKAGLRALMAYDWPGNVRELENLMERMVILKSSGMIDVLDFPEKYRRVTLSEIEYEDLINASKAVGGSTTQGLVSSFVPAQVEQVKGNSQVLNFGANNGQKVVQQLTQEKTGEEGMKISGNSFIKGPIQQSAGTAAQQTETSANIVDAASVDQMSTEIDGTITVDQAIRLISDKMIFPNEGLDFNSVVDQFENILILRALERTGWNRNRAAGLLRLNRTTLVEKLKKKQLLPPLRYGDQVIEGNA